VPHAAEHNAFTRGLWKAWPWITWLLPAALILMRMGGEKAGWETVILMITAPVTIPAIGLLGSLPRFLLRKKGHTAVPTSIAVMLVVQWWGLIMFSLAMEGVGDSGSFPSVMAQMFSFTGNVASWTTALSLLLWAALFIATIIAAVVISRKGELSTQKPSRLPLIALILTPILIIVIGVIASEVERSGAIRAEDHAGLKGTDAQQITDLDTSRSLEDEHWETLQQELSGLRSEVSDLWWVSELHNIIWPVDVKEIDETQYRLESTWRLYTEEDRDTVMDRATAWLEAEGWEIEHRFTTERLVRGTTPNGASFRFGSREDGPDEAPYTVVTVFASSGPYWVTGYGEVPTTDADRDIAMQLVDTDKLMRQDDFTNVIEAVQDPAGPLLTFEADTWPHLDVSKQAWEIQ